MRVLDLFSGIGGFSLGLERAGMKTVAFCEIDPDARRVLAKHWPDVPCFDDVRKLNGDEAGPVELVCGGYPCQPFSVSGRRRGLQDERNLWPEMFRIIGNVRPDWVVAENVAGHISLGLDNTLSDLERIGYTARAFVIPACAIGAPHRRDRVWILAHSGRTRSQAGVPATGYRQEENPEITDDACGGKGWPQSDEEEQGRWIESALGRVADGIPRWLDEPEISRLTLDGKDRARRLRGLGNAIVPQIAHVLGSVIMEISRDFD